MPGMNGTARKVCAYLTGSGLGPCGCGLRRGQRGLGNARCYPLTSEEQQKMPGLKEAEKMPLRPDQQS